MNSKVNLAQKLSSFAQLWSPKVIGELNGQFVKLVKCRGEYPWHSHADEDELFLVLQGQLEIRLRESSVPRAARTGQAHPVDTSAAANGISGTHVGR